MTTRLLLFVSGLVTLIFLATLNAQESALSFGRQSIEIRGEVDGILLRDLDNDKISEIIFQKGRDLLVYSQVADPSGVEFVKSRTLSLPDDVCMYDITESPRVGIVYISRRGVNFMGWPDSEVPDKPELLVQCPNIFRGEKFKSPLNKRIIFELGCPEKGQLRENSRAVVIPDHGKYRIAPYSGFPGRLATRTAELPVAATGSIYESKSIFETLTSEVNLPLFSLADLNNDRFNDFITLIGNNVCAFVREPSEAEGGDSSGILFGPMEHLLSIPHDAASQNIDFGYVLSPIIRDINKDGYADIMFSDDREGVVYIYLNRFASDNIFFAKTPSQIVRTNTWIIEHGLIDLNGDGLDDLVLVQMNKLGIMGGLQAILAKTLEWEIVVYLGRAGAGAEIYPKSPDYIRSIKLPFSFSYASSLSLGRSLPKIHSPYIWSLLGDFNGDKIMDLLVSGSESRVSIYPGSRGNIFYPEALSELDLRSAGQGYKLMGMPYGTPIVADLNNDGKFDMIIPLVRRDSGGIISYAYEVFLSH